MMTRHTPKPPVTTIGRISENRGQDKKESHASIEGKNPR
jgi:hypothetical protein